MKAACAAPANPKEIASLIVAYSALCCISQTQEYLISWWKLNCWVTGSESHLSNTGPCCGAFECTRPINQAVLGTFCSPQEIKIHQYLVLAGTPVKLFTENKENLFQLSASKQIERDNVWLQINCENDFLPSTVRKQRLLMQLWMQMKTRLNNNSFTASITCKRCWAF